jgi:hypothetical protein
VRLSAKRPMIELGRTVELIAIRFNNRRLPPPQMCRSPIWPPTTRPIAASRN